MGRGQSASVTGNVGRASEKPREDFCPVPVATVRLCTYHCILHMFWWPATLIFLPLNNLFRMNLEPNCLGSDLRSAASEQTFNLSVTQFP